MALVDEPPAAAATAGPAQGQLGERLLAAIEPIAERAECATRHRIFSDVADDDGLQYVDLVLEGGGVLGIALIGYIAVLERCGLRFLGVGGTSAGSITACLLAALDEPESAKAARLTGLIAAMPTGSFVDGPPAARRLIAALLARAGWPQLLLHGLSVRGLVARQLGLNPGGTFVDWLRDALDDVAVASVADLQSRMRQTPRGLKHVPTATPIDLAAEPPALKLFASDLSTETRVEFPAMAGLYWDDPDRVSPALFVRASMSVPVFFRPLTIPRPGACDDACRSRWQSLAGFGSSDLRPGQDGDFRPRRFVLVDGGVLSNFPIDAFHRFDRVPRRPTFGVKLRWDERRHEIEGPFKLLAQAFNSARHALDYEFIRRHPDFRRLVSFIDAADHDWLNFDLSDDAKVDLVERGARAAARFLAEFDWSRYKHVRASLKDAYP